MKKNRSIDAELVIAYQLGEKAALAALVKRWHLLFCKKAYWLVKDADLSKDIAQETWQVIMQKINTLKDAHSFGSWALQIVYAKSLDVLREQSKERIKLDAFKREQIIYNEIVEEKVALKKALVEVVQKLPEQQQLVVKLFYVEDYSLREICKILEISIGTAKSRLFYAREKIKQILKTKNYEE